MVDRPEIDGLATERHRPASLTQGLAWCALAAACGAYVALSLAHHKPFHPVGGLGYFDLRVYRGAAHLLLNGGPIYDTRIVRWAHFT